jgi:hypothetical protein
MTRPRTGQDQLKRQENGMNGMAVFKNSMLSNPVLCNCQDGNMNLQWIAPDAAPLAFKELIASTVLECRELSKSFALPQPLCCQRFYCQGSSFGILIQRGVRS